MANSKQAEKRDRQRESRRLRNRLTIGNMRTALKRARAAVDAKAPEADKLVKSAVSAIDRAVGKGVLKRNTGSRYISRLLKHVGGAKSA
ncbi:30S ribosomal protein S20 [Haliangium ochraceum]|uniref:Small ribosomal subunit protein bS20 n=1 Tax=Haliangium ochraceum (strain DSM 14365 / JCM 11303 / SMP-2) TaxID=502025 RepID=D0LI15_HALO1|nr:30S ribosomal protein S20 [Haliangium ochraceum]ACY14844.1 ribosomal protein S20 [Haliangium ochraceum DSM 14365]